MYVQDDKSVVFSERSVFVFVFSLFFSYLQVYSGALGTLRKQGRLRSLDEDTSLEVCASSLD